jgi:hypothetical protein
MPNSKSWKLYSIVGVSVAAVAAIGIGVYRKLKSKDSEAAARERALNPQREKIKISESEDVGEDAPLEAILNTTDPKAILSENGGPRALAMIYVEDLNNFDLVGLNRPPRTAENPTVTSDKNSRYYRTLHSVYQPGDFMDEGDFLALQDLGVVPRDFPPEQIVVVPSHNELNKYMVGYSAPYMQDTNAQDTRVVSPLWAVSFGDPIETGLMAVGDMDDFDLRKYGAKMLHGEGMLDRANDGCHKSQGLNECDAEKAALMSILLERIRLKRKKTDANATAVTPFTGGGQRWNASDAFMNKFNQTLSSEAQTRFTDFYNYRFWHMPKLSDTATHFIHHYAVQNVPNWTRDSSARTPSVDAPSYANQHAVRIGRTIVTDNSRTFA